jgi:hypothetical protein
MGIPFVRGLVRQGLGESVARKRDTVFSVYRAAHKGDDSTNDKIKDVMVTTLRALGSRAELLWLPRRLSPQVEL